MIRESVQAAIEINITAAGSLEEDQVVHAWGLDLQWLD